MTIIDSTDASVFKILIKGTNAVANVLYRNLSNNFEVIRVGRMGYVLIATSCSPSVPLLADQLVSYLKATQQNDGGWADVEETLWCLGLLSAYDDKFENELTIGKNWVKTKQLSCGAWGKSERDQPRIPITALASILVPRIVDKKALKWIADQWKTDLRSPTQLTYKGAFFLLSQMHTEASIDNELIENTTHYLIKQQSDDGGYGPWQDHPIGSDPWSTGIVLWGLSTLGDSAPKDTIKRAVSWLETTQLSNGLWPYHYIDDGSAMALIGLSKSIPILMER